MSGILVVLLSLKIAMLLAIYGRRDPIDLYKRELTLVYLGVVLALFILFYPVLSGLPIPSWYGHLFKWMPTWWFTY